MATLAGIKKAIQDLYGDTSVPSTVTRQSLEDIRDQVEEMIDTLPEESDDDE